MIQINSQLILTLHVQVLHTLPDVNAFSLPLTLMYYQRGMPNSHLIAF